VGRGDGALSARVAALGLAATVALAGCGTDSPMGRAHMDGNPATMGQGRDAGMATHPGPVMAVDEADYLTTMVAHHREAIVASAHLARSAHPELRRLGRAIIRTQSAQVRTMGRWLDRWYPEVTASRGYRPMLSDLSSLTGDDLDRTFLTEMVHHHMMAVMMSRHLVRSGEALHPRVAGLAGSVIEDQTAEIVLMQQWLRDWDLT
jgi:uncharacterized protein (DUF305 family)